MFFFFLPFYAFNHLRTNLRTTLKTSSKTRGTLQLCFLNFKSTLKLYKNLDVNII